ncbi:hypothetical protein Bmyc01_03710 [Bacillus mycoides]|nr:hypothetical protein IC7_01436 [Bacillus cereus BAG1O-1]GLV61701.1 hypothetical protein Bmyc01_03710 [Bacillus mycoides]
MKRKALTLAIVFVIPTFSLSLILFAIYYIIKSLTTKTYLVKNVATGEQFYVEKQDFKQYKRSLKNKGKQGGNKRNGNHLSRNRNKS